MKSERKKAAQELYQHFRVLAWETLWQEEAPQFNALDAVKQVEQAGLIRAVGVVFHESGAAGDKADVFDWLTGLLQHPEEKVRRYAMAALPKIGSEPDSESRLLKVWNGAENAREKKFAAAALAKIGGATTLAQLNSESGAPLEQKLKARQARAENPSILRLDGLLTPFEQLSIRLRGRRGLEGLMREEAEQFIRRQGKFRLGGAGTGWIELTAAQPFSLADIYQMRCFATVGLVSVPGRLQSSQEIAAAIASPQSAAIWQAFTEGAIRYRLNFVGRGHQRAQVRDLAQRIYQLRPDILNDGHAVTWTVDIYPAGSACTMELRPNLWPDPRFSHRLRDVPAASHPPLAACLARLAGEMKDEIVWDPFCGAGSELVECALRGNIRQLYGTDLSADAVAIAQENFAAAGLSATPHQFVCTDFLDYAINALRSPSLTLIITNPPLGMRVPVPDLRKMMGNLFAQAVRLLRPGGRLVLANPFPRWTPPAGLRLQSSQPVDFGGFDCQLEKYIRG